jgi:hypothetical protein
VDILADEVGGLLDEVTQLVAAGFVAREMISTTATTLPYLWRTVMRSALRA